MKKIEITIGQILKILMYGVIISPSLYTIYLMVFNIKYMQYLFEYEYIKPMILTIGFIELCALLIVILILICEKITKLYDKIEHIKIFTLSSKPEPKPNHKAVEDIQS